VEAAESITDFEATDGAMDGASGEIVFDFDRLEALADKSLLRVNEDDEPRVTMLQTIRDYGRERAASARAC